MTGMHHHQTCPLRNCSYNPLTWDEEHGAIEDRDAERRLGLLLAVTPERREDGWEELRRLAEAAAFTEANPRWVHHSSESGEEDIAVVQPGPMWDFKAAVSPDVVLRLLAAARGEPPEPGPAIDVDTLRAALEAMWSHHTEGIGSSPPSPGDHSYEVWDPFLPGSPDSVATALAAALRDKP